MADVVVADIGERPVPEALEDGPAALYAVNDRRLGFGATPFGQAIPTDVRGLIPQAASGRGACGRGR
jgi:hypothetical protein